MERPAMTKASTKLVEMIFLAMRFGGFVRGIPRFYHATVLGI
jgi:hypothetical protein